MSLALFSLAEPEDNSPASIPEVQTIRDICKGNNIVAEVESSENFEIFGQLEITFSLNSLNVDQNITVSEFHKTQMQIVNSIKSLEGLQIRTKDYKMVAEISTKEGYII